MDSNEYQGQDGVQTTDLDAEPARGYDNTNRGAIFNALQTEWLSGTGRVNIDGADHQVAVIRRVNRDGTESRDLYIKVGRLFPTKSENDKAPILSGPMTINGVEKRIAGWSRTTTKGVQLLSVRVEDGRPQGQAGGGGGILDGLAPPPMGLDDEIPF